MKLMDSASLLAQRKETNTNTETETSITVLHERMKKMTAQERIELLRDIAGDYCPKCGCDNDGRYCHCDNNE